MPGGHPSRAVLRQLTSVRAIGIMVTLGLLTGSVWLLGYTETPPATVIAILLGGLSLIVSLVLLRTQRALLRQLAQETRPQPAGDDEVVSRLKLGALASGRIAELVTSSAEELGDTVRSAGADDRRRLEALQNLYALVPVRGLVPPTDDWPLPAPAVLEVADTVRRDRPGLIVEWAGGASTLWCALAVRHFGVPARMVVLQPDPAAAQALRDLLAAHDLAGVVEVCPLSREELAEGKHELDAIELLVVGHTERDSHPDQAVEGLSLLDGRLAPLARVVVACHDGERAAVERWRLAQPADPRLSVHHHDGGISHGDRPRSTIAR